MTAPNAGASADDNLAGMLLMLAATAVLIGQHAGVKHLAQSLPVLEILFFRTVIAFLFFMPWVMRSGLDIFRTRRIGLHLIRAALQTASAITFFVALSVTELATVTALHFTAPIFATIIAVFALGERISFRRWSAILIAFAGTIVILRPGLDAVGHGPLLTIVSAFFWGVAMIVVKLLGRTDSSVTITAYMYLLTMPMTLLPALYDWQWPALDHYGWIVLIGITAALAHLLMAEALTRGDTHVVTPFDFLRLIWASLAGFIFFAETPDRYVWIGGFMIFAGVAYIAWREHTLRARRG